jgi:hypothetical protein
MSAATPDSPRVTVQKAIEFRRPHRLPLSGYGPNSDTLLFMPDFPGGAPPHGGPDEWGCLWSRTSRKNIGQVTGHPLTSLDSVDSFPFPNPADPERYRHVPRRIADLEANPQAARKFRITAIWNMFWERMHMLHGFENCLMALMDDEPGIHRLADRIVDWCLEVMDHMGRSTGDSLDAFYFTDDWGTETNLMISPELFRAFFFPRYQRLFQAAHDRGWKVWMHSCGRINGAIPMLIEAGVDVLNLQQPRTNGIEELGAQFAGKVAFETLCDIQKTLPAGNPEEIWEEARCLMEHWGTPEGGFILGNYGDSEAIGVDPAVKALMLRAFREQDRWNPAPAGSA